MIGAGACLNKKCSKYLLVQVDPEHIKRMEEVDKEYADRDKTKKWWQL